MKLPARIFVGSLTLIGVMAIGLVLMAYIEEPKSHFSTYEELAASDLIAKGWLPPFLPRSISDIAETHSIDLNSVWVTFKYDLKDISAFESNCKLLVASPSGRKYVCPPFEKQLTIVILKSNGTGTLETESNEL